MAIALLGTPGNITWAAVATSTLCQVNSVSTSLVGSKLLAYAAVGAAISAPSCSDNSTQAGTANTWTEVGTVLVNSTVALTIWWTDCTRPMLTTDRATIAWTTSGTRTSGGSEWSGIAAGAPAQTVTKTGTGTTQDTSALSAAQVGDLVMGWYVYGTAIAYTAGQDGQGNPMTVLHQPTPANSRSSLTEYLIESAALAYTPAATVASGTSNYAARAIRFSGGANNASKALTASQAELALVQKVVAKTLVP